MPIDPFKPITYSAARRRYKRATGQSLCTLTARESEFHSGANTHWSIRKATSLQPAISIPSKRGAAAKAC